MTIWSEQDGRWIEAEPIPFTGLGAERSLLDWYNPTAIHPRLPAPPLTRTEPPRPVIERVFCACGKPVYPSYVERGITKCAGCQSRTRPVYRGPRL